MAGVPGARAGILFDLDGTLLDTLEDLADSTNRCLARLGLPGHPVEAYRYFVGDGLANQPHCRMAVGFLFFNY